MVKRKKCKAILLSILLIALMIPVISYADTYTVNEEEMTISFDSPGWIVFTRDNITDNKQLEKLGTDESTMRNTMEKTNAYVVAVKGGAKQRIELLVRATPNEFLNNMSTLDEADLEALLEGVNETYSSSLEDYQSELVDIGEYKYVKMTGEYKKDDYDVVQYLTFVNGNNYLISAQKVIDYTEQDLDEITAIMESIAFVIDPEKTENNVDEYVEKLQNNIDGTQKSTPVKIGMTALVVVVIAFLLWFMNRRNRRR